MDGHLSGAADLLQKDCADSAMEMGIASDDLPVISADQLQLESNQEAQNPQLFISGGDLTGTCLLCILFKIHEEYGDSKVSIKLYCNSICSQA